MEELTDIEKLFLNIGEMPAEYEQNPAPIFVQNHMSEDRKDTQLCSFFVKPEKDLIHEEHNTVASEPRWDQPIQTTNEQTDSSMKCEAHGNIYTQTVPNQFPNNQCDNPMDIDSTTETISESIEIKLEPKDECDQKYISIVQIDRDVHLKTEDLEKTKIERVDKKCLLCEKKFQCRTLMDDYVQHNGCGSVKCAECLEEFKDSSEVLFHSYEKHYGGSVFQVKRKMWFACPICCTIYVAQSVLNKHIRNHSKLHHKCPKENCGWMYQNSNALGAHVKIHHRRNGLAHQIKRLNKSYLCPSCLPDATTNQFEAKVPGLRSGKFKCYHCPKKFDSKLQRTNHIRLVHQIENVKDCPCPQCGRIFKFRHPLKDHLKKHETLKHKCLKCGWLYESHVQLNVHTKKIHFPRTPVPHPAKPVAALVKPTVNFKKYIHLKDQNKEKGTKFKCSKCRKGFGSLSQAYLHTCKLNSQKSHPNVKYHCSQCHEIFRDVEKLLIHIREHKYGKFRYKCSHSACCCEFKDFTEMQSHTINIHAGCPKCLSRSIGFLTKQDNDKHRCNVVSTSSSLCEKVTPRNQLEKYNGDHLKKHQVLKYKCLQCGCLSESYLQLYLHTTKTHSPRKPMPHLEKSLTQPEASVKPCLNLENKINPEDQIKGKGSKLKSNKCQKSCRLHSQAKSHISKQNSQKSYLKVKYHCSQCPEILRDAAKLLIHIREHKYGKFRYKCSHSTCCWEFKDFTELLSHTSNIHAGCPKCLRCSSQFLTKQDYDEHRCIVESASSSQYKNLTSRNQLEKHGCEVSASTTKEHLMEVSWRNEEQNSVVCFMCEKSFQHRESIEDYVQQNSEDAFQCKDCSEEFQTKNELMCHLCFTHIGCVLISFSGKNRLLKCFLCTRRFKNKQRLEQHLKNHDQLPYECPRMNCNAVYETFTLLQSHIYQEHRNKPLYTKVGTTKRGGYVCPKCLTNSETISCVPSWVKLQKAKYKCDKCGEKFPTRLQKHNHMQTAHVQDKGIIISDISSCLKAKFKCDDCGKDFQSEVKRQNHVQSVHYKWKCGKCGMAFKAEQLLISHVKVQHQAERSKTKIKCEMCHQSFYLQASLKVHMRSHSEEFQCTQCEKHFDSKSEVEMHTDNVHNNMTF